MKFEPGPWMTTGSGILLLGVAWLFLWLGPAFHLYTADARWAHNFAFALILIMVGIAYYRPSVTTWIISMIASFITIPTELAYWSGMTATIIELVLLVLLIIVAAVEWKMKQPLINPNPKSAFWLKIHLPVLTYIGIIHMPFIFYLVRWTYSAPFLTYLPVEHEYSTSVFNAMILILMVIPIAERYIKEVRGFSVTRSPALKPLAPFPTSATVPAASCPGMSGGTAPKPARWKSDPQTAAYSTLTTRRPASAVGLGTSSNTKSTPPFQTSAFTDVFFLR